MKTKDRSIPLEEVLEVLKRLEKLYPDPSTELTYESPFQLLCAVILSAQCTDARVNQTTPGLFAKFPTADAMAAGSLPEIEKLVHPCGFYRMKAKALKEMAKSVLEKFGGRIPNTLEDLVTLRGVGRKTASVILNQAFHLPAIAVDTHVARVSNRLGWAHSTSPEKIEKELKHLLPEKYWTSLNGMLVLHGRRVCKARKPLCGECPVTEYCAFYNQQMASSAKIKSHGKRDKGRKPQQAVSTRHATKPNA